MVPYFHIHSAQLQFDLDFHVFFQTLPRGLCDSHQFAYINADDMGLPTSTGQSPRQSPSRLTIYNIPGVPNRFVSTTLLLPDIQYILIDIPTTCLSIPSCSRATLRPNQHHDLPCPAAVPEPPGTGSYEKVPRCRDRNCVHRSEPIPRCTFPDLTQPTFF